MLLKYTVNYNKMLSNLQIDAIGCISRLIDDGHIPESVAVESPEWLKIQDVERFALLNWMLLRWVYIRDNKYHLPKKRSINLSGFI